MGILRKNRPPCIVCNTQTVPHCRNPRCIWVVCRSCRCFGDLVKVWTALPAVSVITQEPDFEEPTP